MIRFFADRFTISELPTMDLAQRILTQLHSHPVAKPDRHHFLARHFLPPPPTIPNVALSAQQEAILSRIRQCALTFAVATASSELCTWGAVERLRLERFDYFGVPSVEHFPVEIFSRNTDNFILRRPWELVVVPRILHERFSLEFCKYDLRSIFAERIVLIISCLENGEMIYAAQEDAGQRNA